MATDMSPDEFRKAVDERLHRIEASQKTRRKQIVTILDEMSEQASLTARHAENLQKDMDDQAKRLAALSQEIRGETLH
ncbi:MAG: hypothetical protein OXG36_13345 [Caldilineaceae bacterium]|nr:hypothetical protein [Caldilineaceae bacterium]